MSIFTLFFFDIHPLERLYNFMKCDKLKENAFKIVANLRKAGFKAFIVGGAVRDMVMCVQPKDYDIATDASPENISQLFERTYSVGAKFGVSVVFMDNHTYEIAQFRKDSCYKDGRRPERVFKASEVEDSQRRDFTINALIYDPVKDEIIDHVSGIDDIHNRIIRTIGNPLKSFGDDHLRLLRAVRFAAQLNFTIEHNTMAALKEHASLISLVSTERIRDELLKMFSAENPDVSLSLLDETGLLEVVLPEAAKMKNVAQPEQFHPEGDVFTHTKRMLKQFGGGSATLAFGILFHDIGKPETFTNTDRIRFNLHDKVGTKIAKSIMKRLRFSNYTASRVLLLVKNHMRFINVKNMKRSTFRRFIAQEGFEELLELFKLDCMASHGNLETYRFVKKEIDAYKKRSKISKFTEAFNRRK